MDPFEIYFADLNTEAQEAYLDFAGLKNAHEANLDVFPLATVEMSEPEPIDPSASFKGAPVRAKPRHDRDVR